MSSKGYALIAALVVVSAACSPTETSHTPEEVLLAERGYSGFKDFAAEVKLVYASFRTNPCVLGVTWKDGSLTEIEVSKAVCTAAAAHVLKEAAQNKLVEKIDQRIQPETDSAYITLTPETWNNQYLTPKAKGR